MLHWAVPLAWLCTFHNVGGNIALPGKALELACIHGLAWRLDCPLFHLLDWARGRFLLCEHLVVEFNLRIRFHTSLHFLLGSRLSLFVMNCVLAGSLDLSIHVSVESMSIVVQFILQVHNRLALFSATATLDWLLILALGRLLQLNLVLLFKLVLELIDFTLSLLNYS